jgi:hypothetical protein
LELIGPQAIGLSIHHEFVLADLGQHQRFAIADAAIEEDAARRRGE